MTQFLNIKNKKVVGVAVEVLNSGGVLVFPTETAYGLAADAGSKKAIEKIYKIKGRMASKFLPLIVGSLKQMQEFFELGEKELELAKKHKGLTIILKIKNPRPRQAKRGGQKSKIRKIYLLKGQNDCAVRISKYKLARELALKLGRPITATSANVSGGENCYGLEEVTGQLKNIKTQPDLIIDGGRLKKRKPSTIVRVEGGKVEVVRRGEIKINSKVKT
ncbi:threonylcarbamoyl-AMP synthase [Candidatus Kuenenbacteria bacterium]|nr:threonylcarbamoyl-AMP synthase [Candidatus Kuenenbacteria bacterium]